MKILYNFPTRERPDRCINTLRNIRDMSTSEDYSVLLKIDSDDKSCYNEQFYKRLEEFEDKVIVAEGISGTKVNAVNRDIPKDGYLILVTMSDDMFFAHKGFDNIIREGFVDDFKGLFHLKDQYARERVCTLPIEHIEYYLTDKYVYHPMYTSVYCDNEMQEVAIMRKKYKLSPANGVLIHMHPSAGFGEADALLERTDDPMMYAKDGRVYHYRKSINFGL